MNLIYPKGKEGFANATINWLTDTIKAVMVSSAYTYSAGHQYLSSVTGIIGSAVTIGSKTNTDGALGGTVPTFSAMTGGPAVALIIYKDTGAAGTSPLIGFYDGKVQVEIAADAAGGATAIAPEDLPGDIANGATLTKITGTGPATITTSDSAAKGARSVSVSALGSNIVAGAVYEYTVSGAGLPLTLNGGDVNINFAAGILSL